jgi:hypothetical protein
MNAFSYATLEGILTRTKKALIRTGEASLAARIWLRQRHPHHRIIESGKTDGTERVGTAAEDSLKRAANLASVSRLIEKIT